MNEALAKEVIERSREAAIKEGVAVCITVVDESGLLAAFLRMEDAIPGAIDVSLKKARTAALFEKIVLISVHMLNLVAQFIPLKQPMVALSVLVAV